MMALVPDSIFLSEVLGTRVLDAAGSRIGRVGDLVVDFDDPAALVCRVLIEQPRDGIAAAAWSDLELLSGGAYLSRGPLVPEPAHLVDAEIRLGRDVLDSQVIDIAGKRLARVSDVLLSNGPQAAVTDVEVGSAAVIRRLGLRRLASHARGDTIAWDALHLASQRGHELQLRQGSERSVHRLDHEALATVVAAVPPHHAAQILHGISRAVRERLTTTVEDPVRAGAHRRYGGMLRRRRRPP